MLQAVAIKTDVRFVDVADGILRDGAGGMHKYFTVDADDVPDEFGHEAEVMGDHEDSHAVFEFLYNIEQLPAFKAKLKELSKSNRRMEDE